MGEREITRMYEYYSAVLHAVREGLLLIDLDGRVQLVNDEARRLLRLPDDVVGRSLDDLGLPPALVEAASGERGADEVYVTGDHVLVASSSAAFWDGKEVGAVVTLRDHTELQAVTGELDIVRGLTESLRAQTHEAANRLHTVVSLIEIGRTEEAIDFVTDELKVAQMLTDRVVGAVGDPVVAALLLGKSAEAAERGISLTVTGELPGVVRRRLAARPRHRPRQPRRQRDRRRRRHRRSPHRRAPRGLARPRAARRRRQRPRALARGGRPRPRARLDHEGRRRGRARRGAGPRLAGRPPPRRRGDDRPVRARRRRDGRRTGSRRLQPDSAEVPS